jgi:hypothetical protein
MARLLPHRHSRGGETRVGEVTDGNADECRKACTAYDKFYDGGGKEWIDKNAPQAREIKVEGVEQK